ncbi:MAG TPA: DUF1223 domain-containing protein [Caulobacteraceae bacterium]|nr:DUF1223 domain-containing protein [Caulobacteraceae bacterium]
MLRLVVSRHTIAASIAAASLLGGGAQAHGRAPIVAELFTSQGCAACEAADSLPAALSARPDVLALTFPVDYWDYLGWRDTYAQPAFSERQKAYAKAMGVREVFTPQVVVEGAAQAGRPAPGQTLDQATEDLIQAAAKMRARPGPAVAFKGARTVRVGAGLAPRGGADVWLVLYQATPADTPVTAGENRGKTVRYHNVVRELERLGGWTGRARSYAEPQAVAGGLKRLVLVQAKGGGRILSLAVD